MRSFGQAHRLAPVLSVLGLSVCLSGCVAAALLPLASAVSIGSAAFTGFQAYKAVQTMSGGSVTVAFPSSGGKVVPAQPLPAMRRVAIWPGDEIEVVLAEQLQRSGRYAVEPPATVQAAMTDLKLPTDLNQMTDEERDGAFAAVCQHMRVDFVFAAQSEGSEAHDNSLSFSRSNVTSEVKLLGYSCPARQVTWQDDMALIADVGSHQPTRNELAEAAGGAWADRVLNAPAK